MIDNDTTKNETFLDHFEGLEDPRSARNQLYPMPEILLTALCAAICGAEGWQDVENYGEAKLEELREYLPYANGIPSDDTFRRFFRSLNPDVFQELFRAWVRKLHALPEEKIIAIDGKSSRHSFDGTDPMLHMISAYVTEARLVLGQEKVSEKSNEITAIPRLLEWLDLKGATVTIDAMGCQFEIANQIVKKEGQYMLALKGNQGNLSEDVRSYFDDKILRQSLHSFEDVDKGHGRFETRKCWISSEVAWLQDRHPQWRSINSIVCIESTREIKGKTTTETRCYIGSDRVSPEKALSIIRSHWAIENSLHWVLDMSFGDDQSRIRKENAPQNMAIVRHMALNLLQLTKAQMKRRSIKQLRKIAGWDHPMLKLILSQKFS